MSQVSHRRKCHRCAGRRYTDTLKISRLRELILFFLSRPPKVRANHPRRLLSVATLINFFYISKVIRLNCLAQVPGGRHHHGALPGPGLLPRRQPDLVHQHRHRGPQHHPGAPDLARGDQGDQSDQGDKGDQMIRVPGGSPSHQSKERNHLARNLVGNESSWGDLSKKSTESCGDIIST